MFTAINYQLSARMLVSRTWPHWSVSPFWHSAVLVVQQTCRSGVCCSAYEHTQRLIDRQLNFYVRIIYREWFSRNLDFCGFIVHDPHETHVTAFQRQATSSRVTGAASCSAVSQPRLVDMKRQVDVSVCRCRGVCLELGLALQNCNLAIAGWTAGVCAVRSSTSLAPNPVWKRFQTAWV